MCQVIVGVDERRKERDIYEGVAKTAAEVGGGDKSVIGKLKTKLRLFFSSSSSSSSSSSIVDFSLFLDPVFVFVSLAFAIANPCVYGIWAYLPSLALEVGLDEGNLLSRRKKNAPSSILGHLMTENCLR